MSRPALRCVFLFPSVATMQHFTVRSSLRLFVVLFVVVGLSGTVNQRPRKFWLAEGVAIAWLGICLCWLHFFYSTSEIDVACRHGMACRSYLLYVYIIILDDEISKEMRRRACARVPQTSPHRYGVLEVTTDHSQHARRTLAGR